MLVLSAFNLGLATPAVVIEPDLVPAGAGFGGWAIGNRCTDADELSIDILLRHNEGRLERAEEALFLRSDPTSPLYGEYLGQEAITKLFEMKSEASAVVEWLQGKGLAAAVGSHGDSVTLSAVPCPAVESLFGTPIHHYTHPKQGDRTILRARAALTMPAGLSHLVATVAPLARLPSVRLPRIVPDEPGSMVEEGADAPTWDGGCGTGLFGCGKKVTPKILAQRYQLGDAPSGPAKGSMAVAEFQNVFWDQAGLDSFSKTCHLPNITVKQMGADHPKECAIPLLGLEFCMEAMLDIEYIKGVGGSVPLTDVFQGAYSLEQLAQTLLALPDAELPKVLSISYGNDEAQAPNTPTFMRACDAAFMKLGLRGVSVLVASGDQGVWGREGSFGAKKFHPDYPASSPYVTSVGGTDFATKNVVGDEKAWSDGGGGFSDTFAQPPYQKKAVATYLASSTAMPDPSLFNASGRAYPDVAALGGEQNPYCVSVVKLMTGVAGTSASTPVFGGVVAKLNEQRLGAGKKTMGFLNPFLYQNPGALNDVTLGENKGEGKVGFKAAPGWDPATGLGTPNFAKLSAAAMKQWAL